MNYGQFIVVVFLLFSSISCLDKAKSCDKKIKAFISIAEISDFEDLYGFSADGIWGEVDENGKRRVYRIEYTNKYKERFPIPSLQKFADGTSSNNYDNESLKNFAVEIGNQGDDHYNITKSYANTIVDFISKYDIKGIDSQMHLGNYIQFQLVSGCYVFYKAKGVILSDGSRKFFNQTTEIAPNWFVRNETLD